MKIIEVTNGAFKAPCRVAPVSQEARAIAAGIIGEVARRGDAALVELTARFDGAKLSAASFRVTKEEIDSAASRVPRNVLRALKASNRNAVAFAKATLPRNVTVRNQLGAIGKRATPIERVGVYVPGGRAAYPSSIIMTVAIAKAAGVPQVIVCVPPQSGGSVNPVVLVAARIAGADAIYKLGGCQAIAAMALGTRTVPRVDKIVGPGNRFVSAAKAEVAARGMVAIDSLAGPSEILVLALAGASPKLAALELVAQAEHAPDSFCAVVCTSVPQAKRIAAETSAIAAASIRTEIVEASLANATVYTVQNTDSAVALANQLAVEHVRVLGRNALRIAAKITNAGAVFIGDYSPVAIGDYYAGPSHVLPTGGSARFSSGLSASSFLKETTFIRLSKQGLKQAAASVAVLANAEGLPDHANSVLSAGGA